MSDIRWQNCYQRYERPGNAALAIMRDITYNIPHGSAGCLWLPPLFYSLTGALLIGNGAG